MSTNQSNNTQTLNKTPKDASEYYGKLANYTLTKTLGDTHLYPVYLAEREDCSQTLVVKTMKVEDDSFANEAQIFQLPEHKHLIKCVDMVQNASIEYRSEKAPTNQKKHPGETKTPKNALIMEFAENGDMFNFLLQGPLSEGVTRYYFEQVLEAVEHMHNNKFCHLDIKLENVLLDSKFDVKLTDFGFATEIHEGKSLARKVGTPGCRPPEMWKLGSDFEGYNGAQTDVFQLGILLYIFFTGMPPFSEANYGDLWYRPAIAGRWDAFWNFKERAMKTRKGPKTFEADFKNLISEMLAPEADARPTLNEIRESNWFKNTKSATLEEVLAEMNRRKENMN